ncbi:MAG: hypothetical protein AAF149_03760 [Bacteroidota bacterium]
MKKTILSLAAALLLVASACTEEKDLDLVAVFSNDYEFEVVGNGDFNLDDEVGTEDLQEIVDELDDELLEGYKRVSIEAIEVELVGNSVTANSITIDIVEITLGGSDLVLFENQTFDVNGGVVSVTDLNAGTVSALKSRLEDLLVNNDFSPIAGKVQGSINDGQLNATLRVSLVASVVGTQEIELPDL